MYINFFKSFSFCKEMRARKLQNFDHISNQLQLYFIFGSRYEL